MTDAIFLPQGDAFMPTAKAASPWGPGVLHGGPPAGLLARAIEAATPDAELHVSRLTIDLFRAVPMALLHTTAKIVRAGRRIAVLEASLFAGELEVARATALLLRPSPVKLPEDALPPPLHLTSHEELTTTSMADFVRPEGAAVPRGPMPPGFHTTLEVRRVSGQPGKGRGTAWVRMPLPLVAGEETTPFVRVAAISDFGNGLGHVVTSDAGIGFINADISLYLHRLPESEWICLEAYGVGQEHGLGMVETVIHDERGPIGRIVQALLANRRHE
jgi:hypothetical protein